MNVQRERDIAIMEGEMAAASQAYFDARPHLDSAANRNIFDAGFQKAWKAQPPADDQARRDAIETLRKFAEGRIAHHGNGLCPDVVEGFGQRDLGCAVCQALQAIGTAQAASAAEGGA